MRKRKTAGPFKESLEYATNRLARALAEQQACASKLSALNEEIPKLQNIIWALEQYFEKPQPRSTVADTPETAEESKVLNRVVHSIKLDVPEHLKRFLEPTETPLVTEEETLPDAPGEEMLP